MMFLDVMRMFEILSPSSDQMSADQMFSSLLLLLISVLVGCLLLSAQWHSCVADLPLGIGQESAVNEMLKSCAGNITNLDIIPDRLCSVLCWIITWLHLHRPLCRCEVSASLIHPTGFLAWRREEELCNTVLVQMVIWYKKNASTPTSPTFFCSLFQDSQELWFTTKQPTNWISAHPRNTWSEMGTETAVVASPDIWKCRSVDQLLHKTGRVAS